MCDLVKIEGSADRPDWNHGGSAIRALCDLEPSKGPAAQSGGNNDRAVPQRDLVGERGMNY